MNDDQYDIDLSPTGYWPLILVILAVVVVVGAVILCAFFPEVAI
ncbi:MAG: hypothetical protein ABIJ57_07250 [Pseudomonadota bacterium]